MQVNIDANNGAGAINMFGGIVQTVTDTKNDFVTGQAKLRNFGEITPGDIMQYISTGGYSALNKALFEMSPEEASDMEVFKLVHGVEIANGGNTPQENKFAYDVAKYLDLTILGGSDAHSLSGLGYYATRINSQINSQDELINALHAGNTDVMSLNKEEGTYEIYQPER